MPRPFAWSHSRLNAFETCPRRHYEVDIAKAFVEDPSPALEYGSRVHKALEDYCRDGTPLPADLKQYEAVGDKVRALPGEKTFENKLGLSADFEPRGFFDKDVWVRLIIDVQVIDGARAAVIDYKTGKVKPAPEQLMLCAAAIFAQHQQVERVDTAYWWLAHGKKLSTFTYTREDLPGIWSRFLPRVRRYETAVTHDKFPPNPSGLCKRYCPVTTCEFHGR